MKQQRRPDKTGRLLVATSFPFVYCLSEGVAMIVFGSRVRHKRLGEGEFFCPKCQATRRYLHKKAVRYFTLYFIPVFPIQQLGEFVECQTCSVAFQPEARYTRARPAPAHHSPEDLAVLMNSVRPRLEKGYPVDYMIRDLAAASLDLDVARGLIDSAIGAARKTCPACGLSYASTAGACAECGGALQ